jgi:antitoxin component YwqK of YwqJK toxin-antitoxin module
MNNLIDIRPFNDKGLPHGSWKVYHYNTNQLSYKGNFINGKQSGYWVSYARKGK